MDPIQKVAEGMRRSASDIRYELEAMVKSNAVEVAQAKFTRECAVQLTRIADALQAIAENIENKKGS